MALLLFVVVLLAGNKVEMSALDPELSSVPGPTNLTIEAFNMNTHFNWEYPAVSQTPVFTVQVKTYWRAKWVDACNTSNHYCYITSLVDDPSTPLWARVKARLGQNESSYVQSKEFTLCKQGKIGPPTLDIRIKGGEVITDIFHPLSMINESYALYDEENACYSFIYNVYVKVHENETIDKIQKYIENDCNETQCQFKIPLHTLRHKYCASAALLLSSNYCVSAEGFSEEWSVTTEMSPESCIAICSVNGNNIEGYIWIPISVAVLLFLLIILVFGCYRLKKIHSFKRESIMLPKSLMSVVKNASSEAKPESKYISPITCQPVDTENEQVIFEEQLSSLSTISGHTEDNLGRAEHKECVDATKVVASETHMSTVVPESPLTPVKRDNSLHSGSNQSELCSVTLNSYHSRNGSDSGVVESDSFFSDTEFSSNNKSEIKTERQEPMMLRNTFGYDKPHVLVDLLVDDDGGKESLIGYRLTAESKEFS
ncbi:PREDICTED: interferon gamma receptor 1 [Condylura cristata]|uniref:interferon gamma receptor 1 n=1 Tax=Condylura cristata TaxID=143302 RepID=UPI0003346EC7|nr:PREDICTED: interferon gamma receptor 1 [Condylura cristata]